MNPWISLDKIGTRPAYPLTWQRFTGEHFPAIKALCLEQSGAKTESYPCPRCACFHRILRPPVSPSVVLLAHELGEGPGPHPQFRAQR